MYTPPPPQLTCDFILCHMTYMFNINVYAKLISKKSKLEWFQTLMYHTMMETSVREFKFHSYRNLSNASIFNVLESYIWSIKLCQLVGNLYINRALVRGSYITDKRSVTCLHDKSWCWEWNFCLQLGKYRLSLCVHNKEKLRRNVNKHIIVFQWWCTYGIQ